MVLEVPVTPIDLPDPGYDARSQFNADLTAQRAIPSFAPVYVGKILDLGRFSAPFTNIHGPGIPIRFKVDSDGSPAQYKIPDELEQFAEAIGIAAAHEHGRYPGAEYKAPVATLAVEQSLVRANLAQRNDPRNLDRLHRDGGVGSWLHAYILSDKYPTEFYALKNPKKPSKESRAGDDDLELIEPVEPGGIVMSNSSTLHRSPVVPVDTVRTFMRLSYSHTV